ncbi:MAG: alginate lyase family protein [Planctomycetota bacterium]
MQTMIAIGVFLDDREMIDRAAAYFLNGAGNGAIGNYFNDVGQCQESGRDQSHTQMGLEFLSNTCQTAWIQGIDLYGAKDNRLLLGFEYTAKYNLGEEVPYERFLSYEGRYDYRNISAEGRGRLRPMYEKILRHYFHRKRIDSPYTRRAVAGVRESTAQRQRYSSLIDTLMFSCYDSAQSELLNSHHHEQGR